MSDVFRTLVVPKQSSRRFEHGSRILMLGSCFSQNIGQRLCENHFDICLNPTGALYNPLSILEILSRLVEGRLYTKQDLFLHDENWISFDHHSDFDRQTEESALSAINDSFAGALDSMESLDVLILTFGTAFVYRRNDTGAVVANCHKLPHGEFTRTLATVDEIAESTARMLSALIERRPSLSIILTISPVRHLRDSPHENLVSKSHLAAAIYQLEKRFADRLYYFPSFEIMMDDLRDYRFYATDMVHPSPLAVNYIWEQFLAACITERSRRFVTEFSPILRAINHRINNPGSASARRFASDSLVLLKRLVANYPDLDLSKEQTFFESLSSGR